MLSVQHIHASIPVSDAERARTFYERTLGLSPVGEDLEGHTRLRAPDGSVITLYETRKVKAPKHPVASIEVDNLEESVQLLREDGVEFEDIDIPERNIRTRAGVADLGDDVRAAWFKDPDGNLLAMTTRRGARDRFEDRELRRGDERDRGRDREVHPGM